MFRHLSAVWTARHFLLALVKLDLRLRYRRSVLGVGWSLLHPVALGVLPRQKRHDGLGDRQADRLGHRWAPNGSRGSTLCEAHVCRTHA